MNTPNLYEYSLIRTETEKRKIDYKFEALSSAFYFVALDLILGLQADEIRDSITDSNFLKISKQQSGHDRGIDALFIDEASTPPTIHMFNFKYAEDFNKAKNNNLPSTEIDKILSFISSLNQKEIRLVQEINPVLAQKVQDIWRIFESQNPIFIFHFCANYYKGFENLEKERLERSIGKNIEIKYHLVPDIIKYLVSADKKIVNGVVKAIDKRFFEKSDGNIRALVVNIDARDLIRIVIDDEILRNKADMEDIEYEKIKYHKIIQDAFNDNVRIYLKKSSINKNIKATALSEENDKFFYYNNGVTLTCDSFSYSSRLSPVIELKNIQVVNGSQTIHSLYEAFIEDSDKFGYIEILCRICEVKEPSLSTQIAEYTNSQNPVKSRDIRSVDFIQLSLEKEFKASDKYYERKRNQYSDKPLSKRIDAEKAGQVLIAFYNRSPYEAKNRKGLIFGDKYEEVFNENINADKVWLAYSLFERIELRKEQIKSEIVSDETLFKEKSYVIHASYYILYIMGEIARLKKFDLSYKNFQEIWVLYEDAINIVEKIISKEQKVAGQKYDHSIFFRGNKSKKYFEELEEAELSELLSAN